MGWMRIICHFGNWSRYATTELGEERSSGDEGKNLRCRSARTEIPSVYGGKYADSFRIILEALLV
jgi:hypothetical protein